MAPTAVAVGRRRYEEGSHRCRRCCRHVECSRETGQNSKLQFKYCQCTVYSTLIYLSVLSTVQCTMYNARCTVVLIKNIKNPLQYSCECSTPVSSVKPIRGIQKPIQEVFKNRVLFFLCFFNRQKERISFHKYKNSLFSFQN